MASFGYRHRIKVQLYRVIITKRNTECWKKIRRRMLKKYRVVNTTRAFNLRRTCTSTEGESLFLFFLLVSAAGM